jgi:phage gp29-like protein
VGKYPTGASEQEKNSLLRAVVGIGHNAGGIIPMGMELEFQEAAKGNEVPFKAMIELCERSVSKAVLGATLTSSEGSHGTQALGNVHREVQLDIEKSDARQVASTLTRDLVYPLYTLNVGPISRRRCPKFVFEVEEPEDISLMADALPKLAQAGMQIETQWAHDKLGIPLAEAGKDVLKGPPPPAMPGTAGAGNPAPGQPGQPPRPGQRPTPAPVPPPTQRQAAKAGAGNEGRDAIDALIDEALAEFDAASVFTPIEATLQRAIDRGLTPEQFRVLLPRLISQVPLDALTETLAQAGFAARLAGEADLDLNS